jgi:hypothetical protein
MSLVESWLNGQKIGRSKSYARSAVEIDFACKIAGFLFKVTAAG